MSQSPVRTGIDAHFEGRSPEVRATYEAIVAAARRFGAVEEDPKKTSIHLNNKTAFAGVQTRRDWLILTVKSARDINSDRVFKRQQASANRWHLEVKVRTPNDVDPELKTWLRGAYELSA